MPNGDTQYEEINRTAERLKLGRDKIAKLTPEKQLSFYNYMYDSHIRKYTDPQRKLSPEDLSKAKLQWIGGILGKSIQLPNTFGAPPAESEGVGGKIAGGAVGALAGTAGAWKNVLEFLGSDKSVEFKKGGGLTETEAPLHKELRTDEAQLYEMAKEASPTGAPIGAGIGKGIPSALLYEGGAGVVGAGGGALGWLARSAVGGAAGSTPFAGSDTKEMERQTAINIGLDAILHGVGTGAKSVASKIASTVGRSAAKTVTKDMLDEELMTAIKEKFPDKAADIHSASDFKSKLNNDEKMALMEHIRAKSAAKAAADRQAKKEAALAKKAAKANKVPADSQTPVPSKFSSRNREVAAAAKTSSEQEQAQALRVDTLALEEKLRGTLSPEEKVLAEERIKQNNEMIGELDQKAVEQSNPEAAKAVAAVKTIQPKIPKQPKVQAMFNVSIDPQEWHRADAVTVKRDANDKLSAMINEKVKGLDSLGLSDTEKDQKLSEIAREAQAARQRIEKARVPKEVSSPKARDRDRQIAKRAEGQAELVRTEQARVSAVHAPENELNEQLDRSKSLKAQYESGGHGALYSKIAAKWQKVGSGDIKEFNDLLENALTKLPKKAVNE